MNEKAFRLTRRNERGASLLEFAFITLSLVPFMLGTGVIGINIIRGQATGHLARDASQLFAGGLDISQPGNQTILANIGSPLGLTTSGTGSAVLIFSALTYVDTAACADAGAVDASGNPSGCTNYGKWVFAQRLIIGNSSLASSSFGSPVVSGPTSVTPDPTTGYIALSQYVLDAGAVANFSSMNPYSNVSGTISGVPSGQYLYICEAIATAFTLPPFVTTPTVYAYGIS